MPDFWVAKDSWPMDPKGYVFLARAVHRIGAAMFGSAWSGNETIVQLGPSDFNGTTIENTPVVAALNRLRAVREEIVKQCEAGELIAAYRPKLGGSMRPMARELWNTDREKWIARFYYCQFHPSEPFSGGLGGRDYCSIFLTAESLERFLLSQPFAVVTESAGHLSPYLKIMLAVARRAGVTKEHQPPKASLEAEIDAMWTGDSPLSENLRAAMATLIREPESQLGRAKKKYTGKARKG